MNDCGDIHGGARNNWLSDVRVFTALSSINDGFKYKAYSSDTYLLDYSKEQREKRVRTWTPNDREFTVIDRREPFLFAELYLQLLFTCHILISDDFHLQALRISQPFI